LFGRKQDHDIDVGLIVALFLHCLLLQALLPLVRGGTTYRGIELDLPIVWIGLIGASFSLLPIALAIPLGKIMDRGHDARAAQLGAIFMLAGSLVLWFAPDTQWHLLCANVLLGIGHLLAMAAHQVISVRSAGLKSRETVLSLYMFGLAAGQAIGPIIMALAAGDARVAPTGMLFFLGVIVAAINVGVGFTIRRAPPKPPRSENEERLGVLEILRLKGLPAIIFASVITVTTFDVLIIYMPLLGTERHIEASHVGWLLTVRAAGAMASRLAYVSLFRLFGRVPLTLMSLLLGAVGLIMLALPLPLWLLYVGAVASGYGLGISSTLAFSGMVQLAPANVRATALSMRLTGNRIGQVAFPSAASLFAAVAGVGGVFTIIAVSLVIAAVWVRQSWPADKTG
jgi:MFS family permease